MKTTCVLIALITGGSLVVCTSILSSAMKSCGQSLERAATSHRPFPTQIPSQYTVRLESGNSPIRLDLSSPP